MHGTLNALSLLNSDSDDESVSHQTTRQPSPAPASEATPARRGRPACRGPKQRKRLQLQQQSLLLLETPRTRPADEQGTPRPSIRDETRDPDDRRDSDRSERYTVDIRAVDRISILPSQYSFFSRRLRILNLVVYTKLRRYVQTVLDTSQKGKFAVASTSVSQPRQPQLTTPSTPSPAPIPRPPSHGLRPPSPTPNYPTNPHHVPPP
ncbi:hypothetical protein CONLIGDRAFT_674611, partial [Coniochaeta ligniaria NRRL 30616]